MRLFDILNTLQHQPLLCSNEYRETLLALLMEHRELSREEFKSNRTGKAKSGDELEIDESEVRDGIGIIPVGGPMGIGLGEFEKGAGAVDMADISDELDAMEADDEVAAIVLNFDSPGGTVLGTFELCDRISQCDKPIYAFASGKMCSAAYAAAAACDNIFAMPSATIGNIGVYTVFHDLSEAARQKGVSVKVISSGSIKGIGTPGTQLTAEQEMFLKQDVLKKAEIFYNHVKANRESIADDDMAGQFYSGDDAETRGFIDGQFSNLEEMLTNLREILTAG